MPDNLLNYPDFRAGRACFPTDDAGRGASRAAQRAGYRRDPDGQPSPPVLAQVCSGVTRRWPAMQLAERQSFLYPPYCRLISLTLRHRDRTLLWEAANRFGDSLRRVVRPPPARARGASCRSYPRTIPRPFPAQNRKTEFGGRSETTACRTVRYAAPRQGLPGRRADSRCRSAVMRIVLCILGIVEISGWFIVFSR